MLPFCSATEPGLIREFLISSFFYRETEELEFPREPRFVDIPVKIPRFIRMLSPGLVAIQHRRFVCSNPEESQKVLWNPALSGSSFQETRYSFLGLFPYGRFQSMSKTRMRSTEPSQAEFPDYIPREG